MSEPFDRLNELQANLTALQQRLQAIPAELLDTTDPARRQALIGEYANTKLQHEVGTLELKELARRQSDLVTRLRFGG
jgi:hypothetical protein